MVTVEGEGGCVCHLVMCSSAGRSFSAKKTSISALCWIHRESWGSRRVRKDGGREGRREGEVEKKGGSYTEVQTLCNGLTIVLSIMYQV